LKSFLPVRPAEETGYPMKPRGKAEEQSATPYRKSFLSWEILKRLWGAWENVEASAMTTKSGEKRKRLTFFCVVVPVNSW
jgi:hypothetical protein